jgi:iron(III) transport system ATP-binding protein
MQREFEDYHRRTGTTMIYITHDQAEAMALADRIAVMSSGRLVQLAPPARLYREPVSRMVAEFIGQASVVLGDVLSNEAAGRVRARVFGLDCVLRAAPGQTARRDAEICLRPDDIGFSEAGAQKGHATIRRMSYRGGAFALEVSPDAAPDTVLRLGVREPTTLATGGRLTLAITDGWVIPAS